KELIRTQHFYKNILNYMDDPVVVKDENHRWVFLNDALYKFWERDKEELIGKSDYDIFSKEEADIYWEKDNKVFETGKADLNEEAMTICGEKHIISTKKSLYKDTHSGQRYIVGTIRDITERKRVEENIRKSEEKFHSLFENMLNGIAYCKMMFDENNKPIDWIYLEINDAFEKITGIKRDIIDKKVTEAIPGIEKDAPELFEFYGKVALTGEAAELEIYLDTLKIWFHVTAYCPEKGYFVAVFEDVTERNINEQKIKDLAKFPSENPNPVIRIAKDGIVLYANGVSKLMLDDWNCREGQFVPIYWKKLIKESLESGQNKMEEVKFGDRIFSIVLALVVDAGYVNLYARDITGRKKTEEALRESEERFRSFLDSATEACILTDSKLNYLAINRVGLNYFPSMTRLEDVVGRNMLDVIPDLEKTGRYDKYLQVIKTGEPFSIDDVVPHPKFGDVYLSIRAFKAGDGLGLIVEDITERKKAEKALGKSEENFRNIFKSVPESLLAVDKKIKILDSNNAFAELLQKYASALNMPEDELQERILSELRKNYGKKEHGIIEISTIAEKRSP
ncbi:MAG TPA: PAS domain S-box protein, partial [Candidatus Scalindua sp.]|nr:PAS domain S-box protein [Candidatus Scalindua sp.]